VRVHTIVSLCADIYSDGIGLLCLSGSACICFSQKEHLVCRATLPYISLAHTREKLHASALVEQPYLSLGCIPGIVKMQIVFPLQDLSFSSSPCPVLYFSIDIHKLDLVGWKRFTHK
jgi:hypothetical protein